MTVEAPNHPPESLRNQVRSAVIWRSGTQILGQMLAWVSTFLVIRILSPSDYGLFAMTQVVLVLLNMLNGYGLASALIQRGEAGRHARVHGDVQQAELAQGHEDPHRGDVGARLQVVTDVALDRGLE